MLLHARVATRSSTALGLGKKTDLHAFDEGGQEFLFVIDAQDAMLAEPGPARVSFRLRCPMRHLAPCWGLELDVVIAGKRFTSNSSYCAVVLDCDWDGMKIGVCK